MTVKDPVGEIECVETVVPVEFVPCTKAVVVS